MDTARIAEPMNGDKLYQRRARAALPILVRQAQAGTPIFYSDLAAELGMPNPRNLNYVLGSIGQTLINLSEMWHVEVPPIQCLVIAKNTGLPGEGIGWFITDLANFGQLSRKRQRQLVEAELQKVFSFRRWTEVLKVLGLKPVAATFHENIRGASNFRGGGESKKHKELKEFIAKNPQLLGLPANVAPGETEHGLPSGDSLDVFFQRKDEHIGVEVKSLISPLHDIVRGLFQCVKYQAVLEARQASEQCPQNTRTVLILEGEFPKELIPLKNILGIEMVDNVKLRND